MDSKWCEICRNFVNNNVFSSHLSGKKHMKNVRNEEKKKLKKPVASPKQSLIRADKMHNCTEIQPTIDQTKIAPEQKIAFNDQLRISFNLIQNPNNLVISISNEIFEHLNRLLSTVYPPCRVIKFGSTDTGLHLKGSDLNMFLDIGDYDNINASVFNQVKNILYKYKDFFTQIIPLPNARTQIIKFKYIPRNTDCNLSFNRHELDNSQMIKYLLSLDPRVKPLIIIIKYWAQHLSISGTGKMTNYSLVIAIIFFLQQLQILPAINYIRFASESPDHFRKKQLNLNSEIRSKYACQGSIPQLIHLFFLFYAQFNFYNSIICPADGSFYRKVEYPKISKKLGINIESLNINDLVCIQDPIRLDQNITSGWTEQLVIDFQIYCRIAMDICEKEANDYYNGLLVSLFNSLAKQRLEKLKNFVYEPNYGARKKFDEIIQNNLKYRQENRAMEEYMENLQRNSSLEQSRINAQARSDFMENPQNSSSLEQSRINAQAQSDYMENPRGNSSLELRRRMEQFILDHDKLGKKLSYLLRHGAKREHLPISEDGYVAVSEITKRYQAFTSEKIQLIVSNDKKQRYSLKDFDGVLKIKANQGHSIAEVNKLSLKAVENPNFPIIHGTYLHNWPAIKDKGLSRMIRNHIHFAKNSSTECGLRNNAQVFIFIDFEKAREDRLKFFESENGVILSPGNDEGIITSQYFEKVVTKSGKLLFSNSTSS